MPSGHEKPYDFYLSFTDSVEPVASEVHQVLERHRVFLRLPIPDHPLRDREFIELVEGAKKAMREAIKNSRDLIILYSKDYEASNFEDFLTFIGPREKGEQHRIIILRCENVPVKGLLAGYPCEDLAGIEDSEERRRRILRACGPPVPQPRLHKPVEAPTVRADRTSNKLLFVCHVSEDHDVAYGVARDLEARGVPCWIAPRNVRPGHSYDDEIAEAIEACGALLLVFSKHCNERDDYIRLEVSLARDRKKLIIPYFIESVEPKKGLSLLLSGRHRINVFRSTPDRAIEEVVGIFSG